MKKTGRNALAAVLAACILLTLIPTIALAENTAVSSIHLGDYIQMGAYNGSPIPWRCVAFEKVTGHDGNGDPIIDSTNTATAYQDGYLPLMLADVAICLKGFDHPGRVTTGSHGRHEDRTYSGSNYWGDSNIRDWLNSSADSVTWSCGNAPNYYTGAYDDEKGFLTNFSDTERAAIKTVTQKSLLAEIDKDISGVTGSTAHEYQYEMTDCVKNYADAYSEQITDEMFLLDVQQLKNVYDNLGDYYKLTLNYWLRSPEGDGHSYVRHVLPGGIVGRDTAYNPLAVRPAFFLDPAATFDGAGTKTDPYTLASPAHSHAVNVDCSATEGDQVVFTAWKSGDFNNTFPSAPGNYALAEDVTIASDTWMISSGVVNLCLNGHALNMTNGGKILLKDKATLNICDCSEHGSGSIKSSSSRLHAKAIDITGSSSTLNLYGGNIRAEFTGASGVYARGVDTGMSAFINIYGGQIAAKSNSTPAAALYVQSSTPRVHISGGVLTAEAPAEKAEYGCYLLSGWTGCSIEGGVFIGRSSLGIEAGKTPIHVTGGIFSNDPTDAIDPSYTARKITSDDDGYQAEYADYYVVEPAPAHTHDGVTFIPWNNADSLPSEAGSYYLTADVHFATTDDKDERWDVPGGEVHLCLNGHTVKKDLSTYLEAQTFVLQDETTDLRVYNCAAKDEDTVDISGGQTILLKMGTLTLTDNVEVWGYSNSGTVSVGTPVLSGQEYPDAPNAKLVIDGAALFSTDPAGGSKYMSPTVVSVSDRGQAVLKSGSVTAIKGSAQYNPVGVTTRGRKSFDHFIMEGGFLSAQGKNGAALYGGGRVTGGKVANYLGKGESSLLFDVTDKLYLSGSPVLEYYVQEGDNSEKLAMPEVALYINKNGKGSWFATVDATGYTGQTVTVQLSATYARDELVDGDVIVTGVDEGAKDKFAWANGSAEKDFTLAYDDGAKALKLAGEGGDTPTPPTPPEHVHQWSPMWSYNSLSNGHFHECLARGCPIPYNDLPTCGEPGAAWAPHSGYAYDDAGHWVKCTVCEYDDDTHVVPHVYDDDQDTTCDTCGYTRTVTPTPPPVEEGGVNAVLEVKPGAPAVVVDGLEAEAAVHAQAGKTVTVTLTVERKKETDADAAADIAKIKKAAPGAALEVLAVTVEKQVDQNAAQPISQTTKPLTITIPFDSTGKKDITVYRCHEDTVASLTATPNGDGEYFIVGSAAITVHASKFSTYAIAYTAQEEEPAPGPSTPIRRPSRRPDRGEAVVTLPFVDVAATDPFYEAVKYVYENKLMVGTSETTFAPSGTLTRGMLAVILYRQAGSPKVEGAPPFEDALADAWYSDAIVWAAQTQVLRGYGNGQFGPHDPVSKEMMNMVTARQAGEDPQWVGDPALAVPATRAEIAQVLLEQSKTTK